MSRGYNKVILMGNLAKDPEMKTIQSGQSVARITVAVGREWKDKGGEKQSQTDFIQCQAWGKLADIVGRYTAKGKPVLVEGRLSVRSYDDTKTGQKRWATEVVLDNLTLLGSGQTGSAGQPGTPREDAGGIVDEAGPDVALPF